MYGNDRVTHRYIHTHAWIYSARMVRACWGCVVSTSKWSASTFFLLLRTVQYILKLFKFPFHPQKFAFIRSWIIIKVMWKEREREKKSTHEEENRCRCHIICVLFLSSHPSFLLCISWVHICHDARSRECERRKKNTHTHRSARKPWAHSSRRTYFCLHAKNIDSYIMWIHGIF